MPVMKFCNIYAHIGTPLKRTSQIVNRCMQVVYMQALWRRTPTLWSSVRKGRDHALDRIGKGAISQFWSIPMSFVLKFMRWELKYNVLVWYHREG